MLSTWKDTFNAKIDKKLQSEARGGLASPWGAHLLGTHGGQPWRRHGGHWGHADLSRHLVHVAHATCVGRHGYIDVHIVIVHAGVCLLSEVWRGLLRKHARNTVKDENVRALGQTGRQFWALVSQAFRSEWINLGWENPGGTPGGGEVRNSGGRSPWRSCRGHGPRSVLFPTLPWRSGRTHPTVMSVPDKASVCCYYLYWWRVASRPLPPTAVSIIHWWRCYLLRGVPFTPKEKTLS